MQTVRGLQAAHAEVDGVAEKLAYLEKREAHMHSPSYRQQGWPIGSGSVESGNKVVMQARLKGAGMHWAPSHVNPLLSLRSAECNQRWEESWQQSSAHRRAQRLQVRVNRAEQRIRVIYSYLLWWRLRTCPPKPFKPARSLSAPQHTGPPRPASTHPWRRRFLAKK